MWFLKKKKKIDTNELNKEIDSQTLKTNLQLPKEKAGRGGINKEFGISKDKLLYIQQINKVLPYNTRNWIQNYVINFMEKNVKKNTCVCASVCVCVYVCVCVCV